MRVCSDYICELVYTLNLLSTELPKPVHVGPVATDDGLEKVKKQGMLYSWLYSKVFVNLKIFDSYIINNIIYFYSKEKEELQIKHHRRASKTSKKQKNV